MNCSAFSEGPCWLGTVQMDGRCSTGSTRGSPISTVKESKLERFFDP